MPIKRLIMGATLAGTAILTAACGGGASAASQPKIPTIDSPTSTAAPTTTTTTTTTAPTTTTTTTQPTTPKPTTPKPKPTTPKPAAPPAQAGGTPCSISDGACIDLSANKSWLLQGGKVIYGPVPITHGRKGFPTPTGMFHVLYKDIDHKSKEFNDAPMPYSVFFIPGIAFHSGSLSVPSHGCIHLSSGAAKTYFNTLKVGQAVQVVA
jgi:lipoprotein-anchoring transpeptidase ErfK/SrfK